MSDVIGLGFAEAEQSQSRCHRYKFSHEMGTSAWCSYLGAPRRAWGSKRVLQIEECINGSLTCGCPATHEDAFWRQVMGDG
jgi:hypothetical protein